MRGQQVGGREQSLPPGLIAGDAVLDIGDGVGALVIQTDAALLGREIEVSREGGERRVHVAVLARGGGGVIAHAAVFPALAEGDYVIWAGPGARAQGRVRVGSGTVAEVDWRSACGARPRVDIP